MSSNANKEHVNWNKMNKKEIHHQNDSHMHTSKASTNGENSKLKGIQRGEYIAPLPDNIQMVKQTIPLNLQKIKAGNYKLADEHSLKSINPSL